MHLGLIMEAACSVDLNAATTTSAQVNDQHRAQQRTHFKSIIASRACMTGAGMSVF
jgi:hypothetical protein